jgi:hypothetical protein
MSTKMRSRKLLAAAALAMILVLGSSGNASAAGNLDDPRSTHDPALHTWLEWVWGGNMPIDGGGAIRVFYHLGLWWMIPG